MILIIDNYDSFVDNLARHFGLLGRTRCVVRNDRVTLDEIEAERPQAVILSPGPCAPAQAGICVELVRRFSGLIPILGVCLGHQCIGEAFGAPTIRAAAPCHGRASVITHDGAGLFAGLPPRFAVGRYHSLMIAPAADGPLAVTARLTDDHTDNAMVMAVSHRRHTTHGVQFHPESVLTENGLDLLANFMQLADRANATRQAA